MSYLLTEHRPMSIYFIISACSSPFAPTIADRLGCRGMYLLGSLLSTCFIVAGVFTHNIYQFTVLSTLHIATFPLWVSGSISILDSLGPPTRDWRRRPISLLVPMPLMRILTLLCFGILLINYLELKTRLYTIAAIKVGVSCISFVSIPKSNVRLRQSQTKYNWLAVIGIAFGLLAYTLPAIWIRPSSSSRPINVIMLVSSLGLILAFVLWGDHQHEEPADIICCHVTTAFLCIYLAFVWATITMNPRSAEFLAYAFHKAQSLGVLYVAAPGLLVLLIYPYAIAVMRSPGELVGPLLLVTVALLSFIFLAADPVKCPKYAWLPMAALGVVWQMLNIAFASW